MTEVLDNNLATDFGRFLEGLPSTDDFSGDGLWCFSLVELCEGGDDDTVGGGGTCDTAECCPSSNSFFTEGD